MYGYWRSAGAYLGCAPPHGWLCVFCQLQPARASAPPDSAAAAAAAADAEGCSGAVSGVVQDPFGRRVYLAPLGLSASVEGALIQTFELSADHRQLLITLALHAKVMARATVKVRARVRVRVRVRVRPTPAPTPTPTPTPTSTPTPTPTGGAVPVQRPAHPHQAARRPRPRRR